MATLTPEQKKFILGGGTISTDDSEILKAQEDFIRENQAGGKPSEGIKLPEAEGLPDVTDQDGLVASLPSVDEEDIRRQTEASLDPARAGIRTRFGRRIGEATEEARQEGRALTGQLGTQRRFSTSALAFIKFIDTENQKRITALEQQREEALADFDLEALRFIDKRIQTARSAAQQEFNNITKLIEAERKREQTRAKAEQELVDSEKDSAILSSIDERGNNAQAVLEDVRVNFPDATADEVFDLIDRKQDLREAELEDRQELLDLFTENPDSGINPKVDTLEEAKIKVAQTGGTLAARREERLRAGKTIEPDADNLETISNKEVLIQLRKMVPDSGIRNQIISELTNEQTREFTIDFRNTQIELKQSLPPDTFFAEWKKEAGIEKKKSTSKRQI